MTEATAVELDAQYRAMREEAVVVERPGRARIAVSGPEAADYLQGQLTNDVEGLEPGQGAYAALLDRKGRIQSDLRALRVGEEEFLLDAEALGGPALLRHISMYRIGREVEVSDRGGSAALLSVIGPRATQVAGAEGLGPEHAHRRVDLAGAPHLAVATDLGVDLLLDGDASPVADALAAGGAEHAGEAAAEILRVESGRPRYGREMTEATMPAEAGIVDRAISFTKGCYIGQEPVARLHYRGKPNRRLRGLQLTDAAEPGDALTLGEKEVGMVGTACVSPALGPIALAILRREAEPGATVSVAGRGEAEVVELPFVD